MFTKSEKNDYYVDRGPEWKETIMERISDALKTVYRVSEASQWDQMSFLVLKCSSNEYELRLIHQKLLETY